jgi:pyridoxamine 5'-phosphate oxidase family protein
VSAFTPAELTYLTGERRLARLATVGSDGMPHVAPVGFTYNPDLGVIDIGGRNLLATKKFHDVQQAGRAAAVVDDLATTDPWRPRGVEIRGRAEALTDEALIRIWPDRIVSWGLDSVHQP